MAQNQIENKVKEALQRAQQFGEIFLTSLSKADLERAGFDASPFGEFEFADIFLIWDGSQFHLKYLFNGEERNYYYERERQLGGEEFFIQVVEAYLSKNKYIEEQGNAEVVLVKAHPLGPAEGAIYVYEVRPQKSDEGMKLESFFVASFCDDNTEIPWGMGFTPKEAIEDAVNKWDRFEKDDEKEENPFKKVLKEVYSH